MQHSSSSLPLDTRSDDHQREEGVAAESFGDNYAASDLQILHEYWLLLQKDE